MNTGCFGSKESRLCCTGTSVHLINLNPIPMAICSSPFFPLHPRLKNIGFKTVKWQKLNFVYMVFEAGQLIFFHYIKALSLKTVLRVKQK